MPAALLAAAAVALLAASAALLGGMRAEARREALVTLRAIADLRGQWLDGWLKERRADAEVVSTGSRMAVAYERWLAAGARPDAVEEELKGRIAQIGRAYGYAWVELVDAAGIPRIAWPEPAADPESRAASLEAIRSRRVVVTNAHLQAGGGLSFVLASPVQPDPAATAPPAGALVYHVDFGRRVLLLLEHGPTRYRSAHTLLLQREGTAFRELHAPAAGATRSPGKALPLRADDLARRAVAGETEMADARDAGGQPVLAAVRRVSGTEWWLLATVSRAEVDAPVLRLGAAVLGFELLVVVALAVGARLWWSHHDLKVRLREAELELERSALVAQLGFLWRNANDAILLVDEELRVREANGRAEELFGYTREELLRLSVPDLRADRDATAAAEIARRIVDGGSLKFESLIVRKDGGTVRGEVSARRLEIGGRPYIQSLYRDVTERVRTEERLSAMLALSQRMTELPEQELAREGLREAIRMTRSRAGALHLVAGSPPELVRLAVEPGPEAGAGDARGPEVAGSVWALDAFAGTTVVRNTPGGASGGEGPGLRFPRLARRVSIPVVEGGEVRLVLGLGDKETDYDSLDVRQAELLAADVWRLLRRKRAEAQAETLRRLYGLLSTANRAIVRATGPEALAEDVCALCAQDPDIRLAWIGLVEPGTDVLRLAGKAGEAVGYLEDLVVSGDESRPEGRGPSGEALRTLAPAICADIAADPHFAPWKERALRFGLRSSAAFPLRRGTRALGALGVYFGEAGILQPGHVELFEQLAEDVALALEGLGNEARRRAAEGELRAAVQQLEEAERLAGAASCRLERTTGRASWSAGAAALLGVAREELPGTFEELLDGPVLADDAATLREAGERLFGEGRPFAAEFRIRRPDGATRRIAATAAPRGAGEASAEIIVTLADVTARHEARERGLLWESVLSQAAEAVFVADAARRIVGVNRAFEATTGWKEEDVVGRPFDFLWVGRSGESSLEGLQEALRTDGRFTGELWSRRKDGELFPALVSVSEVRHAGELTQLVAIATDLTEKKWAAQQLDYLAHHDPLTGLPNRALFAAVTDQLLATARREGKGAALLSLDLDVFRAVNETLGHEAGDEAVRETARRIASSLRATDVIARPGGGQFVMFLDGVQGPADAGAVAQKLLAAVGRPMEVVGQAIRVTASVGLALFPADGDESASLLRSAEAAMYHAKEIGRNTYQFFAPELNRATAELLDVEARLVHALERDEFVLHIQPQVDLATGRTVGAEVLVRWEDPDRGTILPGRFVPLAEERGLVVPLGELVLRKACREGRRWHEAGPSSVRVAVNISAVEFRTPGFDQRLRSILEETGLPPRLLELELTESLLMRDTEHVLGVLQGIRALGVQLAIDDFGTGFSSLSYLRRFPIDRLKIDQSFVRDLWTDAGSASIVRAVIALARSLKVAVIAEGVENRQQLAFLKFHGCEEGQGYLLGRPAPAAEFDPGRRFS